MKKGNVHTFGFLVLFVCNVASGQPAEATQVTDSSHLHDKGWAIQFSLQTGSGGFLPGVSPFQGSLLSLKYQLNPTRAVRVGLKANFQLSDNDADNLGTSSDSRNKSTGVDLEIITQYLFYASRYERSYFFVGIGPTFQFAYSKSTQSSLNSEVTYRNSSYGGGLSAALGAEYFPLNWLSLSCEYRGTLKYVLGSSSSPSQKSTFSTFRADGEGVRLGSTVYF